MRCPAGEALDAAGVEALDSTGGEALDAAGGELDAAGGDAAGGELDAARRAGCWNLGFFLIRHIRRRCLRRSHRQRRWARERLLVLLTASLAIGNRHTCAAPACLILAYSRSLRDALALALEPLARE